MLTFGLIRLWDKRKFNPSNIELLLLIFQTFLIFILSVQFVRVMITKLENCLGVPICLLLLKMAIMMRFTTTGSSASDSKL